MQEGDEGLTVTKHKGWTKTERHLYGNQAVRVLGSVDHAGRIEVEFLTGDLAGLRRWMTTEELQRNANGEAAERAGDESSGEKRISDHVTGQCDRTERQDAS